MSVQGLGGVPPRPLAPAGTPGPLPRRQDSPASAGPGPFARVLAETVAGLRISEHARQRLSSSGLGADALQAVGRAVERLAAHGGRESLVIYGDAAFVVSVKNRTLITVVPAHRMREQVFTNIDSAVLLDSRDNPSGAGPAWEAAGERRS